MVSSTWNKACILKLIWLLFFQAGSVWVAWFKDSVLNGNLNSFCRFWSDNWSPFGNLQNYFCNDSNFSIRIAKDATLSSLYSEGNWDVPHARSEKQLNLQAHLTTLALTETEDSLGPYCLDCRRNTETLLPLLAFCTKQVSY